MSVEEYVASLETNAMILGIVALNMKNFACQIIQHVNGGGPLDEAGLATLKAKCVRSLKNTAADGVPLEQERHDASGVVYTGEMLIKENGTSVLVTHCDRMSESLTRAGNQLFDREGNLYYLYIQHPTTLASRPELDFNTIIRKRSAIGRFDAGSVGLTLPSAETLTADTDVCAETRTGRYQDSLGNRLSPSIITISMPYRDSYIRIVAAFRQISDGRYDVIAFEPFVRGGVNDITISDFASPSFAAQYGGESLMITSGTLQVSNYTTSSITLSANLQTAAGVPVKFTANVKLQRRS